MIDSSAKSSFRELDDVFLQTQTRVWLGEVLNMRFDEDLPISDLLQDGEILFEVSKVVWSLLTAKSMELRHLTHKLVPFGSKKSSGRYRPYSNVDSFLKICKILGLTGIDLFSPSDVVEKRNTRKVCICIRALSKKSRSKQLSVPDFDVVIYSVPMSTDMVGVIRRSLESSQCSVSSSSSYTSQRASLKKLKMKKWDAAAQRGDDSSSDESDEAESRYRGENLLSPAGKLDHGYQINSNTENSNEAHSISRKKLYSSDEERYSHSDATPDTSKNSNEEHSISRKKLYSSDEERYSHCDATPDTSNMNFAIEKDHSVVGDSSCVSTGENEYISNYLAFSDLMVHAIDGDSHVILDGEKNLFDFFLNVDSQKSGKGSFRHGSQLKFSDDEDMEVASTSSMTSVLGRLLSLECDDQFDEDEWLSTNIYSSESKDLEAEKHDRDALGNQVDSVGSQEVHSKLAPVASHASTMLYPPSQEKSVLSGQQSPESESEGLPTINLNENLCLENRDIATDENREVICLEDKGSETAGATIPGSAENLQWDNHQSDSSIHLSDNSERSSEWLHRLNVELNFSNQGTQSVSFNDPCLSTNGEKGTLKDANESNGTQENNVSNAENGSQDSREHLLHTQEENISDGNKGSRAESPPAKRGIRPILKTAAKGTAVAGVLFLLLQIRKIRGNFAQTQRQPVQVSKHNESRQQRGSVEQTTSVRKGIYPSEKIKL